MWLQDNSLEGAKVLIENDVVTINIAKGVYSVTNDKRSSRGVMDEFIQKAINTFE